MGGEAAAMGGSVVASIYGQHMANEANTTAADRNRLWQKQMANSAHQREVRDLIKAGLNPILSTNSGAQTPQTAAAQVENEMEGAAQSAQSYMSYKMQKTAMEKQLEKTDSEIKLMTDQAKLMQAQSYKANMDAEVQKRFIPEAEVKSGLWQKAKEIYHQTQQQSSKESDVEKQTYKRNREAQERLKQNLP